MSITMNMDIHVINDLDFSENTTTTSSDTHTSDDDHGCNWNHWSPIVNWDALTGDQNYFHGLIDSLMDDVATAGVHLSPINHQDACNSPSTTSEDITTTTDDITTSACEEEAAAGTTGDVDFNGLRLIHLMMAAAEALTGENKSRELARVILVRLKELVSPTHGTNMERLAAYFTEALQGLLDGTGGAHNNKHYNYISNGSSGTHREDNHHRRQTEMLGAFQLLQEMSPYVKFSHFTSNQAIVEAVANERRVHIVDYDIMEGIQWASLIEAFASNKNGLPAPYLRITALSRIGTGRRSIATVQETGRRLTAFAASLGHPFSFHHCRLDSDETFQSSSLKLVRGEALVFNCMLHLPHLPYRAPDSIASFLNGAKSLKPKLITLAEEEVVPIIGHNAGFVGRFMNSLNHYSALYDSLEAGFPMQNRARALVEQVFFGPRIASSVAQLYWMGEEDEERGSWLKWLGAVGFRGVPISSANQCQARLLLGLFNDGYGVKEFESNKLVLDWKSRRLISVSVWTSSSESDT
ncbi:putative transcription factor GRAS family [Lupinus albus]|uniref:Putative transcription factor GRAS family n=1 Tax=Lupinus albus TaxID=3870 RepID=A0A6A4NI85_LUPAL|nr:putative transcription factor GRAS family [Lupinus albus]